MTREEAINVIKGWVLAIKDREALETLIPELKKKIDNRERIKKNCIHFLELQKSHHASTVEIDECIDWLKGLVPPKWLYRLEYKDETCGLWYNGEGKWCFEQGIGSLVGCKTKDLPMDHDERYKQDGRDWFSSCSNKEDLLHWYSLDDANDLIKKGFVFTRYLATEYHEYENETVFIKDSSLVREEIDIFELFGKTKPMFKDEDWIIYKDDHTREEDVLVVSNPDPNGTSLYTVKGQQKYYLSWNYLKDAKLWTLQDAKPGDILKYYSSIFILKESHDNFVETYCVLYEDDGDFIIDDEFNIDEGIIKPASREQRDRLFARIKGSGYEWDEKDKKLVNSTLKEKEEIDSGFSWMMNGIKNFEAILGYIKDKDLQEWLKDQLRMNETEGWTEEDKKNYKEILVYLERQGNSATLDVNRKKWRVLESWFKRRVPELSFGEEDKKMIDNIISDLRELRNNETNEELIVDYNREIDWLIKKMYKEEQ